MLAKESTGLVGVRVGAGDGVGKTSLTVTVIEFMVEANIGMVASIWSGLAVNRIKAIFGDSLNIGKNQ